MGNCSSVLAFLKTYYAKLETFKAYPHVKEKIASTERIMISSLSAGNDLPACFLLLKKVLFILRGPSSCTIHLMLVRKQMEFER